MQVSCDKNVLSLRIKICNYCSNSKNHLRSSNGAPCGEKILSQARLITSQEVKHQMKDFVKWPPEV